MEIANKMPNMWRSKFVKNSIAGIAPHYTMKRQLDDYYRKFYDPMGDRCETLCKDGYAKAREIAAWKEDVAAKWDGIKVVSVQVDKDTPTLTVETGKEYDVQVVLDENGLDNALGVDIVTTYNDENSEQKIYSVQEMNVVSRDGNLFTFKAKYSLSNSGSFRISFRMYPKNADLPHKQDFCYVRWFN